MFLLYYGLHGTVLNLGPGRGWKTDPPVGPSTVVSLKEQGDRPVRNTPGVQMGQRG